MKMILYRSKDQNIYFCGQEGIPQRVDFSPAAVCDKNIVQLITKFAEAPNTLDVLPLVCDDVEEILASVTLSGKLKIRDPAVMKYYISFNGFGIEGAGDYWTIEEYQMWLDSEYPHKEGEHFKQVATIRNKLARRQLPGIRIGQTWKIPAETPWPADGRRANN